jgi:hypothetical protein
MRVNLPNQSPSIDRRTIFEPALQLITERQVADPSKLKSHYQLVLGADEFPNDPQLFRPAGCVHECGLFAGFSLASCLAGCRR